MRYGGSQQSPEKFIIFHAPTKNDRSHGRFLLSSRAYFDADFNSSSVICFSTNSQQIIIQTLPKLKKAHIIIKNRECVAHCAFEITLSQTITLTLLLVCSFSPRVHSIPRGPHFPRIFKFRRKGANIQALKTDNLMDFWGSWQVLTRARTLAYVTEQGSAKTPKRRELSVFNRVDGFLSGDKLLRYF